MITGRCAQVNALPRFFWKLLAGGFGVGDDFLPCGGLVGFGEFGKRTHMAFGWREKVSNWRLLDSINYHCRLH